MALIEVTGAAGSSSRRDLTRPAGSARNPLSRRAFPAVRVRRPMSVRSEARPRSAARQTGLALAALGVVFGDIGTSPLYALHAVFTADDGAVKPTPDDVYGIISLVAWSITVIVSIKFVTFIMRADNHGEGGVLALVALLRRIDLGNRRVKAA